MTTKKARTTLYMDDKLYQELKDDAGQKGLSINQLIVASLYDYLREKRLQHYNVYENHVTLWDGNISSLVDVYIIPKESNHVQLHCSADLSSSCSHCQFTKKIPKVINMLTEKGLKIVD